MSAAQSEPRAFARSAAPAATPAAAKATPVWERRAFYRYGFVALILAVWEVTGPFINPIFFTYPSKIATAFVELSASGELPHFLGQSLEVMLYGLLFAIAVGIPLGVGLARMRRLDRA